MPSTLDDFVLYYEDLPSAKYLNGPKPERRLKIMPRTLVEHAAYELTKAGLTNNDDPEARKASTDVIALVRRFEKQNHHEKDAQFVMEAFSRLCNFLPLTPLTDDPDEWDKFEIDRKNIDTGEVEKKTVWQSKRASAIFSEDQGKTFIDQKTGKTGESVDHIEQAKQLEKEEAERKARKENAAKRTEKPVGNVAPDVPAGEAQFEGPKPGEKGNEMAEPVDNATEEVNKTEETK